MGSDGTGGLTSQPNAISGQTPGPLQAPLGTVNSNIGILPFPGMANRPIDTQSLQMQMDPLNPPALKTLVYSPDVQILIEHMGAQYDISADLVRGQVVRKENSASSLFFTVANKGLKYNGLFSRMDRVVVNMKRIDWVQVFAGYLDNIPWIQAYPGTVDFKATCTLKRLIFTYWNPALVKSQALFNQQGFQQAEEGDGQTSATGESTGSLDAGLGPMLRQLLVEVGNWPVQQIHIQNFPSIFYQYLTTQLNEQQGVDQKMGEEFAHLLLGDDISSGPGRYAGSNPSAGAPGPYLGMTTGLGGASGPPIGDHQAFYVQQIVTACDAMGMGPNTSDLQFAKGLGEAGAEGSTPTPGAPLNAAANKEDQKAFQGVGGSAGAFQQQLRGQDAAILAVCCALTESSLLMYASNVVPESLNFPHDAVGMDHDSIGLFQQRPSMGWGTVAQLMDDRQSAMIFLGALQKLNWANMNPASAIQAVQRSAFADGSNYQQHMTQAQQLVQTYRSTVQGASKVARNTAATLDANVPGLGNLSPDNADPNLASGSLGGALPSSVVPLPASPAASSSLAGAPNPNSEGAINCGLAQVGKPYSQSIAAPAAFDCSSLMQWAYRGIGIEIGRNTYAQYSTLRGNMIPYTAIQRGDIIQNEGGGHTFMWLGGDQILEAADYGIPVHVRPNYQNLAQAYAIFHVCENGGVNPAAPYNDPATGGPGMPPSAISMTAGGTGSGAKGTGGSEGGSEPIARNLFTYQFYPGMFASDIAEMFHGENAYIDDQPLLQMVQAVAAAGLRNFASAPNGDFVAYYPDYFGTEGKPVAFQLQDIELKDLRINLSDDPLTTHAYVCGNLSPMGSSTPTPEAWLSESGTASVENEWLYARMRAVAPGDSPDTMGSGQQLMARFGVRPLTQNYAMANNKSMEIMMASKLFMQKWAEQYQTTTAMTFMPELFPGMRVELANHNLQVYISEVTHDFDFESGFNTQASIIAPSNPNAIQLANAMTVGMTPAVTIGGNEGRSISPSQVPSGLGTGGSVTP